MPRFNEAAELILGVEATNPEEGSFRPTETSLGSGYYVRRDGIDERVFGGAYGNRDVFVQITNDGSMYAEARPEQWENNTRRHTVAWLTADDALRLAREIHDNATRAIEERGSRNVESF